MSVTAWPIDGEEAAKDACIQAPNAAQRDFNSESELKVKHGEVRLNQEAVASSSKHPEGAKLSRTSMLSNIIYIIGLYEYGPTN
ncbi:MAG: hypothetical protein U0Q11_16280 [Vicinamibacterales bacterium]